MIIKSLTEGLEIFKALGSDIRIEIILILMESNGINMNELAARLNITNGALTSHIKKLEECGIVDVSNEAAGHGNQKKCSVKIDKLLIDFESHADTRNVYQTEIRIGHFSDYRVLPTCGLSTAERLIGQVDDARYFSHPDRYDADILWLTRGFVEYSVPNFIPARQKIEQITITAELASEAPGYNDIWPSDISFYINGTYLGMWTSPGDFGEQKGLFTPDWWPVNWNQYGLLKILVIDKKGSFIDGLKISNVTVDDLGITNKTPIKLKFGVEDNAEHIGGMTIFGKTFGNYSQNINVRVNYSPLY